jgi:2-phosphoglycerate kinase
MQDNDRQRPWAVFLLGGASGVGKTSLSYRLAYHLRVGLTEVDVFQVVLETMTTPEQQPVLHFWRTHPAPHTLAAEEIARQGMEVGRVMMPGLVAVVLNHYESNAPVVLEGDFIIPALIAQPEIAPLYEAGRVRAAFVHEPDEAQLLANYLQREPEAGPQHLRAQVSWYQSEWLKQ